MGAVNGFGGRVRKTRAPDRVEMAVAAKNRSSGTDSWLLFLKANPATAKKMGKGLQRARANFSAAYPGATRTAGISNKKWRKAGYEYVVGVNEELGLKKS